MQEALIELGLARARVRENASRRGRDPRSSQRSAERIRQEPEHSRQGFTEPAGWMPERRKPINVRRGLELVRPLWTCNVIILSWLPSLPPEPVLPTDYPIPINSAATIYHCPRKSHSPEFRTPPR
ncbi:hypothetical protein FA13DRAFT_1106658 [Coprinellus micaceus]|uniref:Uncharacterized protein n=1 Tax=Coprinellus micaceus TaxID=71717 RepID=A0A4Y7RL60_COPMI|nr:hypothetical protein FA13DRAFT_1106658 [Coprinellus micaceus]